MCYTDGKGVPENLVEAANWLERAAEAGHAKSLYELGRRHFSGLGTSKNEQEGVRYFRVAAEQGSIQAMLQLGRCYRDAEGTAKDLVRAFRWFSIAAAYKLEGADVERDSLVTELSLDEVNKAKRKAEDYIDSH